MGKKRSALELPHLFPLYEGFFFWLRAIVATLIYYFYEASGSSGRFVSVCSLAVMAQFSMFGALSLRFFLGQIPDIFLSFGLLA